MGIPTFTVEGVTSLREVPYYQAMGVLQLNSYDKNNDMLITVGQARLPVAHQRGSQASADTTGILRTTHSRGSPGWDR